MLLAGRHPGAVHAENLQRLGGVAGFTWHGRNPDAFQKEAVSGRVSLCFTRGRLPRRDAHRLVVDRVSLLLIEATGQAGSGMNLDEASRLYDDGAELLLRTPSGLSRLSKLEQSTLIIGLEYLAAPAAGDAGISLLYGYDICVWENARLCMMEKPVKWFISAIVLGMSLAVLVHTADDMLVVVPTSDMLTDVPTSDIATGSPSVIKWSKRKEQYRKRCGHRACFLLVIRTPAEAGERVSLTIDRVRVLLAGGQAQLCADMDVMLSVFAPWEAELVLRAVEGQPQKCNAEGGDLRLVGSKRRVATVPQA